MAVLRTLIVDGDAASRIALRAQLASFPVEVLGEAAGAREAAQLVAAIPYDLVIMEVELAGISGLELARQMQSGPRSPQIIFIAAQPQQAAEAFAVGAADYILKPVERERLGVALSRVVARTAAPARQPAPPTVRTRPESPPVRPGPLRLPVESNGKTVLLDPNEIIYVYALDEQIFIKLAQTKLRSHYTMRQLEERLGAAGFARTHRRYLVNLSKVREVVRYFKGALGLIMEDGSEVPVSRALSPGVRPRLGL